MDPTIEPRGRGPNRSSDAASSACDHRLIPQPIALIPSTAALGSTVQLHEIDLLVLFPKTPLIS